MRRDRINSCIEQLKALLEKEFHKQDPNAKLEKADVLEMTVAFLKQQLLQPQSSAPQRAHSEGFSQCWKETLHFLSANSLKEATLPHLRYLHATAAQRAGQETHQTRPASPATLSSSSSFQTHGRGAPVKQAPGAHKLVWRPW